MHPQPDNRPLRFYPPQQAPCWDGYEREYERPPHHENLSPFESHPGRSDLSRPFPRPPLLSSPPFPQAENTEFPRHPFAMLHRGDYSPLPFSSPLELPHTPYAPWESRQIRRGVPNDFNMPPTHIPPAVFHFPDSPLTKLSTRCPKPLGPTWAEQDGTGWCGCGARDPCSLRYVPIPACRDNCKEQHKDTCVKTEVDALCEEEKSVAATLVSFTQQEPFSVALGVERRVSNVKGEDGTIKGGEEPPKRDAAEPITGTPDEKGTEAIYPTATKPSGNHIQEPRKRTPSVSEDEEETENQPVEDHDTDPEDSVPLRQTFKVPDFHQAYVPPQVSSHQQQRRPVAQNRKRPRMYEPVASASLPHYHVVGAKRDRSADGREEAKSPTSSPTCKSGDIAVRDTHGRQLYYGFHIGQLVDVNSDMETWQPARVRYADQSGVFVHYEGWGPECDEWVDHDRVSKLHTCPSVGAGPRGREDDGRWEEVRAIVESMGCHYTTGLVYCELMLKHECACSEPEAWHPEQPARIAWILEAMDTGLLLDRCAKVRPREVDTEELALVHDAAHIQTYGHVCDSGGPAPPTEVMECGGMGVACDTVFNKEHTPLAALYAAGSLLEMVTKVVSGDLQNGFAVIRPPGHHAENNEALGFCFFNNVAVAAAYATRQLGLQRVMIVDWDIHHGNGTQDIFYDSRQVLYMSLHRHDAGHYYPYTGAVDECGEGEAEGFNVNIPWREGRSGCSNVEYLSAFEHVIVPIARAYSPDLVIVSAGFDAAEGDRIGGYAITPEGYAHMTHQLMVASGGRLVLALEGGYDYGALPQCAAACMRTLLGDPLPPLPTKRRSRVAANTPTRSAQQVLRRVLATQQAHWPDLTVPDSWALPASYFAQK